MHAKSRLKMKIAFPIIVLATVLIIFSFAVPTKRSFDSSAKLDGERFRRFREWIKIKDEYMPMSIKDAYMPMSIETEIQLESIEDFMAIFPFKDKY